MRGAIKFSYGVGTDSAIVYYLLPGILSRVPSLNLETDWCDISQQGIAVSDGVN